NSQSSIALAMGSGLVSIFQYAAVLEIVHSVFGLVKTSAATTFTQVFSRVACVFLAQNVPLE
ncbi:protein tyrosine phosphatase-like domain-containing protein, partial [Klebsiella aerogenes]|uniref:protein tyrosine phosphatase-like domain-containing protein n=1 Tax=Klebsiella aerogenes TaxID=548 RepID=UPI001954570C